MTFKLVKLDNRRANMWRSRGWALRCVAPNCLHPDVPLEVGDTIVYKMAGHGGARYHPRMYHPACAALLHITTDDC